MRYEVEIDGRLRSVNVIRAGDGFAVDVEGRTRNVDAARIDAHTLSLVVGEVWPEGDTGVADAHRPRTSHEVTISGSAPLTVQVGTDAFAVTLNGRRRRKDEGGHTGAQKDNGSQQIAAPMPGKVIRVLVQSGEAVRARQPLVVVEAMKMENELRAGRDGQVAAIHVQEGTSVDAGTLLIELA